MATQLVPFDQYDYLKSHHLEKLVHKRQKFFKQKIEAEEEISDLNKEIGAHLTVAGVKSVYCEGYQVSIFEGKSSSVSKTELLKLGVPVETILQATRVTTYTTVMVRKTAEDPKGE